MHRRKTTSGGVLLSDKMIDFVWPRTRRGVCAIGPDTDNAAYAKYRGRTIAKAETIYSHCHSSPLFLAYARRGANGKDERLVTSVTRLRDGRVEMLDNTSKEL